MRLIKKKRRVLGTLSFLLLDPNNFEGGVFGTLKEISLGNRLILKQTDIHCLKLDQYMKLKRY